MALNITDFGGIDSTPAGVTSTAKLHFSNDVTGKEKAGKTAGTNSRDTVDISAAAYARSAQDQAETPDDSSTKVEGTMYGGNMKILQEKGESAPADATDPADIQKQIEEIEKKIREAEQKLKAAQTSAQSPAQTPAPTKPSGETGDENGDEAGADASSEAQQAQQELSQYQALLSQLQLQLMQVSQKSSS